MDDLTNEISLILLEKDAKLICDLAEKDELKFYIKRIVYNQYKSKTSPFYVKYRKNNHNDLEIDTKREYINNNNEELWEDLMTK